MKKGEPRFFLNWQMSEERANQFYDYKNIQQRESLLLAWLTDDL